ncbi:MAG: F0F1 ATP synthase subunit B [Eubacteriales bacterium]|nr:F0F1 ATP synthase subunit B [Eubacteriales bacterium]
MQSQDLVTIVPWTFVAQICNLFIQMYLIKRFLFKPISDMLERRKEKVDAELKEAVKANDEAQQIRKEYLLNMLDARTRANEIVAQAQKTASIETEDMIREAEHQVAAIKSKAEAEISLEKQRALNEIKDEIGGMAMEIAEKVIEREINEDDHAKLIESFIADVGEKE